MARKAAGHGASKIPARRIQNLTTFLWKCMWHERHVLKLRNVCLLNPQELLTFAERISRELKIEQNLLRDCFKQIFNIKQQYLILSFRKQLDNLIIVNINAQYKYSAFGKSLCAYKSCWK
jgi:hypothetical protein